MIALSAWGERKHKERRGAPLWVVHCNAALDVSKLQKHALSKSGRRREGASDPTRLPAE